VNCAAPGGAENAYPTSFATPTPPIRSRELLLSVDHHHMQSRNIINIRVAHIGIRDTVIGEFAVETRTARDYGICTLRCSGRGPHSRTTAGFVNSGKLARLPLPGFGMICERY
jgi:hypothetical protein